MERRPFYAASLATLRYLEARSPTTRRFGADADALWRELRGHLTTADRIDLLLRDADAAFPGAFGARQTYHLRAVAEDDAFGADFEALPADEADELWRAILAAPPPATVDEALLRIAQAWDLSLAAFDVGTITPATKLLAAGPGAVAALVRVFAGNVDLSFVDQITVVASPPGHRQLASAAAAILNAPHGTRLVHGGDAPARVDADRVLVSPDADPADRAWALANASS